MCQPCEAARHHAEREAALRAADDAASDAAGHEHRHDGGRRSMLRAFVVLPFAAKKATKKTVRKVPAKKAPAKGAAAATTAATTTAAPLTLAPVPPPSTPAGPPPTTVAPVATTTALSAADVTAKAGTAVTVPGANFFLIAPAPAAVGALRAAVPALGPSLDVGVIAVATACTHQGCPTAACGTSGWWECACHGSRFDVLGFRRAGPAPAGLSYFPVSAGADGKLVVDARSPIAGAPSGAAFIAADATGPACV